MSVNDLCKADEAQNARKLLLGRSAKPTPSAFRTAVQGNNVEGLKLLVKVGSPEVMETCGSLLLLAAIEMGHISVMEYLVRLPGIKLELTQTDQYSRNALHLASISGKTEVVRFLLQHLTITISAVDEDGRTALHYAVMRGYNLIAKLLLPRASSDILREDFKGLSPLDHAVRLDDIIMVKTLIDSMLPDDPLRHRSAALLYSVSERPRQFNILLAPSRRNQHRTPRQPKLHLPGIEILEILLGSGYFNLNRGYLYGRTVLHNAVSQPYWLSDPLSSARDAAMSRLNLLLNTTGINVNARDDKGRTPKSYVRDAQLLAARLYDVKEYTRGRLWLPCRHCRQVLGESDRCGTPGSSPACTNRSWEMMESRKIQMEVVETMLQMLIDAGAEY